MKKFYAEVRGGDPLTDEELQEAAELKLRVRPRSELAKALEPILAVLRKLREEEELSHAG
jgi:hypothetical protein